MIKPVTRRLQASASCGIPWIDKPMTLILLLGSVLLTAQSAQALDDPMAEPALESTIQLDTFDAVWNQVRTQYFDYARIESDWLAAREEFRPQAAAANKTELRNMLNSMLERVGESHFVVLPPTQINNPADEDEDGLSEESSDNDSPDRSTGLSVRLIDDALIIHRVEENNSDQIKPGWELVAIGDQVLQPLIEETLAIEEPTVRKRATLFLEASANGLISFQSGDDALELTLLDANDDERMVTARTFPEEVNVVQIGNLPGLAFSYRAQVLDNADDCVGIMTFTSWVPELMDRFLESRDELFACQGLIIDLRGNLGGVLSTMMPLVSHMVSEMTLLGQLKREDGRIDFRVFPRTVADDGTRITPFEGPVAILIDSLSASTSEMFSAGMQALGRARIFGTQSPGMALPAQMLPLPNGDRLMYAFADYIDGEGRRVEGIGVTPDHVIEPSREDLLKGSDLVLDAATTWIEDASTRKNAR